jgi:saccharopine dehydrogenase-like NADP-dependent oxidoreductase
VPFDVNNTAALDSLVKSHDLVVSLLPFTYHTKVAKVAISHHKNMLTASYVSPEMKALDAEAKQAGIIILNEMGLDPGIDHMSAMRIIDAVHQRNGKIDEFYSFCGALPAPDYSDNPFRYKFSWSPRGVVMASRNNARYKKEGKVVNVANIDLFKDCMNIIYPGIGPMEIYPNRDSLPYMETYGISEAASIMRGTIRYPGWCDILDFMLKVDLLSLDEINLQGKSFARFMREKLALNEEDDLKQACLKSKLFAGRQNVIEAFDWLGLFSNETVPADMKTSFDIIAGQMIQRMMLGKEEKDMVLLMHTFKVSLPDGRKTMISSRMTEYGSPSTDTAVAATVALPAAIAARMVLDKKLNLTGVHIPVLPQIYNPVLDGLSDLGIKMEETYPADWNE